MKDKYLKLFGEQGLNFGKCLGSKSKYREMHPEDLIVFNARIYTKKYYEDNKRVVENWLKGQDEEIWYGDLDLSLDIYKLYKISREIGEVIVITTELGSKVVEIGTDRNIVGFVGDKPVVLKTRKRGGKRWRKKK